MEIERRAFMQCAAAAALALVGPGVSRAVAVDGRPLYLSACRLADGTYAIAEFDPEGMIVRTIPLPDRGHGFAITSDRRRAVAFARHPRTFAVAFDIGGSDEPVVFACPPDRHFYGHGVFVSDDRLLLATENDFDNARGVAGVYDVAAGFRRIGELDTNGVGPHELVILADGRTAAIANGGIDTHPDAGDAKLNLATMTPSLIFVDTENGDVLSEHRLEPSMHQLSIRHLAVDAEGSVWFGCQYEGPSTEQPPLLGRASVDGGPLLITSEPTELRASLRNYVGSVAATADGRVVAASSPRGGEVVFFDLAGNFLGAQSLPDGCGLAPLGDGRIVATSGEGRIVSMVPGGQAEPIANADLSFDNHVMSGISA